MPIGLVAKALGVACVSTERRVDGVGGYEAMLSVARRAGAASENQTLRATSKGFTPFS